jgi:outer membrane protein
MKGKTAMKPQLLLGAVAALALALPGAAQAGSPDGKIQVKVLGTAVLPNGDISDVKSTTLNLPAGTDTKANDNYVPTIALEYFVTPQVSVETICCLTSHTVNGAGAISGVNHLIDKVLILPATLTFKYHVNAGPVKPYVGIGPSYFLVLDTKADVKSKLGFALQAGFDIPVNDKGMGISVDAKRYFMKPLATFENAAGTTILKTRHDLDPWVLSAGLSFRF